MCQHRATEASQRLGIGGAAVKRRRRRISFNPDAIRVRLDEAATELAVMADQTERAREQRAKPRPTREKTRTVQS